jgi:uncharacterized Zn finger protein (UPF0148 family)
MFDKLIRDLKKYEKGVYIEVQIGIDDDGYYDRQCPSSNCQADYKVFFEDWKNIVRDEQVFCPICKYEAPATEWNTPEQQKYLTEFATAHMQKVIGNALKEDTRKFNRQQRKGFIQLSMHYRSSPTPIVIPVEAADVMQQKFTCENCGCKYASIGAAFFCPACGHNSVLTTFYQTLSTVRQIIDSLPTLRNTLLDSGGLDMAENSIRHILEDTFTRLVGAFQRFTEALFESLPNQANFKRRKNVFQNLDESSTLWQQVKQIGYEQLLPPSDYDELQVLFQKRHLLAHKDGNVDQEYIDKTGDTTYSVGQRLVIREKDVLRMNDLIDTLAQNLQARI